jgi:hypothetical protein
MDTKRASRAKAKVDDATAHIGPAVQNRALDASAGCYDRHPRNRAKPARPMRAGHFRRMKRLAVRTAELMVLVPVDARQSFLGTSDALGTNGKGGH